ncbi:MAG TPA: hypothetical protein VGB19_10780 [Actinomycetota bacterium]
MRATHNPRRHEVPWIVIGAAFVAIMAGLAALGRSSGWPAGLLLLTVFGGLAWGAWRWGADSRDGADWKPRGPGAVR